MMKWWSDGGSARILRALAPHFAELLKDPVEVAF